MPIKRLIKAKAFGRVYLTNVDCRAGGHLINKIKNNNIQQSNSCVQKVEISFAYVKICVSKPGVPTVANPRSLY